MNESMMLTINYIYTLQGMVSFDLKGDRRAIIEVSQFQGKSNKGEII
jgi:hypothetical protein